MFQRQGQVEPGAGDDAGRKGRPARSGLDGQDVRTTHRSGTG